MWAAVDEGIKEKLSLGLDRIDVESADDATFRHHNTVFLGTAAEAAGVDCVVDNSKSVSGLRRLLTLTDLEIHPVHILRDPRDYAYSQGKRKELKVVPAFSYVG